MNTIHSSVATNYEMNSALEHDIKQFSNDMTKMKDAVKLMLASAETEMGQVHWRFCFSKPIFHDSLFILVQ